MKPGSILESLYPPSNHGPDKCLICGLSFRDHLQCWWYPHLYSSYDRHLDEIRRNGIVYDNNNQEGDVLRSKEKSSGQNLSYSSIRRNVYETGLSPIFSQSNNKGNDNKSGRLSYHSRYVREVNNSDQNNKKPQSQNRITRKSFRAKKRKSFDKDGYETLTVAGLKYSVPMVQFDKNNNVGDFLLVTARVFTLTKLDQLLWIQRFENRRYNHI